MSADAVWRALRDVQVDRAIAADSGLVACRVAGHVPDVVIGDMDSVPPELLGAARARGSHIEVRSRDKDATDLELALDLAVDLAGGPGPAPSADPVPAEAEEIVVVGSDGGRIDHLMAVVGLLGAPRYARFGIRAWLGDALVVPVRGRRTIEAEAGATVTLLALHGPVGGVTTEGLRWPVTGGSLDPTRTLGVSNRSLGASFAVEVATGVVTVVLPGPEPAPAPPIPGREDAPDARTVASGPRPARRDLTGRRVLWQR